jgi:hypothetical protein
MVKARSSRQRQRLLCACLRLGFKSEEKPMKRNFQLSKAEQEEIELWYHNMDPQELMTHVTANAIPLKSRPKLSKSAAESRNCAQATRLQMITS